MEYKDLEKINQNLRTIDVKGKNYVEVNERIKAFRMLFPDGFIDTEMLSNQNGICIFKAQVGYYDEEWQGIKWLGVGHAYEKEGSTFINKTSYIENCETSAVGRALGMAGFGIDTSVASAEEVQNAIIQQEDEKPINKSQISVLQSLIKDLSNAKEFYDAVLTDYNVTDLSQLTSKQYGLIIKEIQKIKGE